MTHDTASVGRGCLSTPTHAADRHLPGEVGMWVFVTGELWIFSCYFATYLVDRHNDPTHFLGSPQRLHQTIGVVNTLALLTGSWLVALAVRSARASAHQTASWLVLAASACGAAFVLLKGIEWVTEWHAGFTITTDRFFMYYYMLTGLHLVHAIAGVIVLIWLHRRLRGPRAPQAVIVETGATYWHLVDALWLVIYVLLYLLR